MQNFELVAHEMSDDLKRVDKVILDFAKGKSELIQEITNHIISSGGKRIRPILHLIFSELCQELTGDQNSKKSLQSKIHLAAAIELIHTATLLHDDVVDNSFIRRNKKTANAIWDNKASILVGDFLFSLSFQLMVLVKNFEVLDLLAKTSSIIADGEIMQLQHSTSINLSAEQYFEIIFGKTAALFSATCESAALNYNCDQKTILAARNFGKNLGIIFQITDDILDYKIDDKTLGKEAGNDFFEGKITLPMIIALKKANESEKQKIEDILKENRNSSEKNEEKFNEILLIFDRLKILEESAKEANKIYLQAKNEIKIFHDSQAKSKLESVLDYAIFRIL